MNNLDSDKNIVNKKLEKTNYSNSDNFIIDEKIELSELKSEANLLKIPEILFLSDVDQKLNDPIFKNENSFEFFVKWARENMFLNVIQKTNYDRDENKDNCFKKKEIENAPSEFILTLPKNLNLVKIKDIPFIIKQINIQSLGENLPKNASWLELGTYLITLISYLEENNKPKLVKKYKLLLNQYFTEDEKFKADENIMNSIKNNVYVNNNNFEEQIEGQVCFIFKKYLFESFFEGGTKMLYDYMKAPDDDEYGSLKKDLDPYYLKLENARKTGDLDKIVKAEKILVKNIYKKVSNYKNYPSDFNKDSPYKTVWSSLNFVDDFTFSANIIKNKSMLCLGKTILIQGLLDNYKIKNEVAKKHKHIFNLIITSDNKTYIFDGTDSGSYIFLLNKYQGKNKFDILSESNDVIDKEDVVLSDMLLNSINFGYLTQKDILPLELAIKINPDNVSAMFQLGVLYFNWSQKEKGYNLLIQCKQKLVQIRKSRNDKNGFNHLESEIDKKIKEMKKNM